MAGASVTFELREVDAVRRLLAKAALDADGRRGLLKSVGKLTENQTGERFDSKRGPDGDSWKALAQRTQDYYAEKGLGHRTLLDGEGNLRRSVTHEIDGEAWSVLVGATMKYAAVHQFGATIRPRTAPALGVPGYGALQKVTIPARPYLGISPDNAGEIARAVAAFLAGGLG